MSVNRRKNKESSRWQIHFFYVDPISGLKEEYRRAAPKTVTTKAQAMALERELRIQKEKVPSIEVPKEAGFSDFAGHWKETRTIDWKPANLRSYEINLRCHLVPFFADTGLRSIQVESIEKYKVAKVEKGLSPKTINNHLGILSSLFNDAIKWGYADKNPVLQVRKVRSDVDQAVYSFWEKEESTVFLLAVQQHYSDWLPFFMTALRTGMRLGELAALCWSDIEFERSQIVVCRSYSHGYETLPKGGKRRTIPMSPQLTELLKAASQHASSERVFSANDGSLLDSNKVKRTFWGAIKKAGVSRIRIHDLRHSFASQLVIAGRALYEVMELLGHRDIKTTQRYAHLSPAIKRDAVGVLDEPDPTAVHSQYIPPPKREDT
jgi:integrase